MTPTIEKLLVIQDHDLRVFRFERELTDIPERKALIESQLDDHRTTLAQSRDEAKARQAEVKKAELEVASSRDKIRKLREQQMQLKSNREFRAMEDEIAAVDKGIRAIEDKMLDMMEGIEAANALVRQREAELKVEEDSVKREVVAVERRAGEIREEMERVKQNRSSLAGQVDADKLRQYERIVMHTRERALVPVENGTCGGCHMKLPPYLCHEAKKQTDTVMCDFCQRLLY